MRDYLPQSHQVSGLMAPLVCPAPYRRVVFDAHVDTVRQAVGVDLANRSAILCLELGTENEQGHCLMPSSPTDRPTTRVQTSKRRTARAVVPRVPGVKEPLWGGACWSQGSCRSPVGRQGHEAVLRQ